MTQRDDDDGSDPDTGRVSDALDAARQHMQDLERRLEQLQQQLLAKGTRDVLENAREAVEQVAREALDELKNKN